MDQDLDPFVLLTEQRDMLWAKHGMDRTVTLPQ